MSLLLLATILSAPVTDSVGAAGALSGRVTDPAGAPLVGALVVIEEAHRSTTTDHQGRYRLRDVPEGTWGVSFRSIGFRPRIIRVTIDEADVELDVVMQPTIVELAPIQTTATPIATSALESPQPLTVLQGAELDRAQAASLGAVLDGQPGVRSQSTGNGIAKPVIRGLSGNRVLVLDNGQRTESQQWGDEHAPNIETAAAERIEVIRGPASVLYGSDALGGVINVVARELPDASGTDPFVRGRLSGGYASNGAMPSGALLLEGATGGLGVRATLSGRTSDDVGTPTGKLANSGLDMLSTGLAAGWRTGWGALTANWTRRNERLEIHEDPEEEPGATPMQRVVTDRLNLGGNLSLGSSRLVADIGWERNAREEFHSAEADAADEVELGLRAGTLTADLHLHHAASSRVAGVVGVQALRTRVDISGEETLVPASNTVNIAAYGFEQVDLGRLQLSVGARVDRRTLDNEAAADLELVAGERDWTAITGNAGASYRLGETTALVLNLGRGFRAPSAFELFANGVHEGTRRYEVGDPDLDTERSFNVDLAIRVQGDRLRGEIGVFNNRIDGYIHPDPTAEVDPESGLQVFRISQGLAVLRGAEASLEWHATDAAHLRGGIDYTWGINRTTDQPLPMIAPLRLSAALRLEPELQSVIVEPWIEFGVEHNTRQGRLDPEEIPTDGYTLARLGLGAELAGVEWYVQVDNLFDVRYRGFLSRYKAYADEMGRNLKVGVAVRL